MAISSAGYDSWAGTTLPSGQSPFEQELHKIRQAYSLNGIDTGNNPTGNAWFDDAYEQLLQKYPKGFNTPVTGNPGSIEDLGSPKPPNTPTPQAGFNPSPTPVSGSNPFGYIPGQLGIPEPAKDLAKQIPGLDKLNAGASGVIQSYLGGELPADVQAAIQDASAKFGITSGMPGAGLARNRTARDLGLTSLDLTNKGLAAYSPFVGSVSATQTVNPALQAQIAETNAINAAAPDPTQAASYAKQLFDQYMANLAKTGTRPSGGSGGLPFMPSGGTGGYGGGRGGLTPTRSNYDVGTGYGYSPPPVTGSPSGSYGVLQSDMNPQGYGSFDYGGGIGDFGNNVLGTDSNFGLTPDTYAGTGDYFPNYVTDWFGGGDTGGGGTLEDYSWLLGGG